MTRFLRSFLVIAAALTCFTAAAMAQLSINTSNPTDWKISNGALTLDWNSLDGHIFSVHLNGYSEDLVDTTTTHNGQPYGLYMDNAGVGSGATTASYHLEKGKYLDWWMTTESNAKNAFTYSQHFIITPNDPGIHVYFVANHSATDIPGSLGQVQYVFRVNLNLFTHTYSMNTGPYNMGPSIVPLPSPSVLGNTDPGRQVQNAVLDIHGLQRPAGFTREFYTKYDYSSYEYFHRAHGVYGSQLAVWTVIPNRDTLVGGPTKQDLIFTDNILMMECLSNHLDNDLSYTPPQGVDSSRLFGPYYFRFNAFNRFYRTPGQLYHAAIASTADFQQLYDNESVLEQNGYIPSWQRGRLRVHISGLHPRGADHDSELGFNHHAKDNRTHLLPPFAVLSDNQTNFQYSARGYEYWVPIGPDGNVRIKGIVPGTYRLSVYEPGQWGEMRVDNIVVNSNQTTRLDDLKFTPENFSSEPPIWTIGTPDRSAHEFLHGHNAAGQTDREYWGNWNYWADFASTDGGVIYYATSVGATPATNNLNKWNYTQWGSFDPGLYAGIYNPTDDSTDGYKYILPSYVSSVSQKTPAWQIHFTTTAAQQAQGKYVVLSVGLASTEADVLPSLNGGPELIWHGVGIKASDAMLRSGDAGTYQWVVYQWNTSQLNPPGKDNVITLTVNRPAGVQYDALRLAITNQSAAPSVTGWHDYEFLYGNTYVPANDAVSNP